MKNILFTIGLLFLSCCGPSDSSTIETDTNQYKLTLIDEIEINVTEPSGLTLSNDKNYLYTVSDDISAAYKLNLEGVLQKTIKLNENYDLEGICCESGTENLWVIDEESRTLIKINQNGDILFSKNILDGSDNSGLEGICYDENNQLILIKEKNPAYFIKLDENFEIEEKIELNFDTDFSSVAWDSEKEVFLLLSQESETLHFYNPDSNNVSSIELSMSQAEGIAYDSDTNILYIVDDNSSKLYKYLLE